MDAAEVPFPEREINYLSDVLRRFGIGIAHRVRVRGAVGVLAAHRRVRRDDPVITPTVVAQAEHQLKAAILCGPQQKLDPRAPLFVHRAGNVHRPTVSGKQAPDIEQVVSGLALHVHDPEQAANAFVIELRRGPVLQRQRLAAHVIDPGPESDAVLVGRRHLAFPLARLRGLRQMQAAAGCQTGSAQGGPFEKPSPVIQAGAHGGEIRFSEAARPRKTRHPVFSFQYSVFSYCGLGALTRSTRDLNTEH